MYHYNDLQEANIDITFIDLTRAVAFDITYQL